MINIKTERLEIRPLQESDLEKLVEEIGNMNIAKYLVHVPFPYSIDDARDYYERSKGKEFRLNLILDGQLIGGIGLNQKEDDLYEVGYWVGERHWGKGYATESVKGILNYLKENKPNVKVMSQYIVENAASGRVLKKCGFKVSGEGEVYIKSLDQNFKTITLILDEF